MGVYYQLSCRTCAEYVSLGKKLHRGHGTIGRLQGLFSEKQGQWLGDEVSYLGLQRFFLAHEGHELLFGRDDDPDVQSFEEADVDQFVQSAIDIG